MPILVCYSIPPYIPNSSRLVLPTGIQLRIGLRVRGARWGYWIKPFVSPDRSKTGSNALPLLLGYKDTLDITKPLARPFCLPDGCVAE